MSSEDGDKGPPTCMSDGADGVRVWVRPACRTVSIRNGDFVPL